MRELPEPDHKAQCDGMLWPDAYSPELVLTIQKQAYEDGLRDAVPNGYVLVPKEPTIEMLDTFRAVDGSALGPCFFDAYRSMLTASQKEQQ